MGKKKFTLFSLNNIAISKLFNLQSTLYCLIGGEEIMYTAHDDTSEDARCIIGEQSRMDFAVVAKEERWTRYIKKELDRMNQNVRSFLFCICVQIVCKTTIYRSLERDKQDGAIPTCVIFGDRLFDLFGPKNAVINFSVFVSGLARQKHIILTLQQDIGGQRILDKVVFSFYSKNTIWSTKISFELIVSPVIYNRCLTHCEHRKYVSLIGNGKGAACLVKAFERKYKYPQKINHQLCDWMIHCKAIQNYFTNYTSGYQWKFQYMKYDGVSSSGVLNATTMLIADVHNIKFKRQFTVTSKATSTFFKASTSTT
ncbi:hypothetical protein RFI_02953 [Reticulomyxa filosa]|uniref:Uncharacterized protein n=1 Tax=Reticulomyxa filosa TaxID=46433 RepID=X6P920_RETFI|nr:hypothetical protein RFI_02953 [Reticulomyxa filosa]|eukprot:ETO34142.1 hypothetical protein RFI_02953 [Reticulomyxa filosa]